MRRKKWQRELPCVRPFIWDIVLFTPLLLCATCGLLINGLLLDALGFVILCLNIFSTSSVKGGTSLLLVPLSISSIILNPRVSLDTRVVLFEYLRRSLVFSISTILPRFIHDGIFKRKFALISIAVIAWYTLVYVSEYREAQQALRPLLGLLAFGYANLGLRFITRSFKYEEIVILLSLKLLLFTHLAKVIEDKCTPNYENQLSFKTRPSNMTFYAEAILTSTLITFIPGSTLFETLHHYKSHFTSSTLQKLRLILGTIYTFTLIAIFLIIIEMYIQCSTLSHSLIKRVLVNPFNHSTVVVKTFQEFIISNKHTIIYLSVITAMALLITIMSRRFLVVEGEQENKRHSRREFKLHFYRKTFHITALVMFVPLIYRKESHVLIVSSTIVISIMIYLEMIRANKVMPLSTIINRFTEHLISQRDRDVLALSHIYLLFSFLCATIMDGVFHTEGLISIGILIAVGIGDSAASLVGSYYRVSGTQNTNKSFIGTLAFCVSSTVAHLIVKYYSSPLELGTLSLGHSSLLLSYVILQGLMEFVSSGNNDNLILPLYTICLELGYYFLWSEDINAMLSTATLLNNEQRERLSAVAELLSQITELARKKVYDITLEYRNLAQHSAIKTQIASVYTCMMTRECRNIWLKGFENAIHRITTSYEPQLVNILEHVTPVVKKLITNAVKLYAYIYTYINNRFTVSHYQQVVGILEHTIRIAKQVLDNTTSLYADICSYINNYLITNPW